MKNKSSRLTKNVRCPFGANRLSSEGKPRETIISFICTCVNASEELRSGGKACCTSSGARLVDPGIAAKRVATKFAHFIRARSTRCSWAGFGAGRQYLAGGPFQTKRNVPAPDRARVSKQLLIFFP